MSGRVQLCDQPENFVLYCSYCFMFKLNSARPLPGGDLHYHLSQHGVFSEKEMRFYATEIILGLEHMHNRFVVYRDLKVRLFDTLSVSLP